MFGGEKQGVEVITELFQQKKELGSHDQNLEILYIPIPNRLSALTVSCGTPIVHVNIPEKVWNSKYYDKNERKNLGHRGPPYTVKTSCIVPESWKKTWTPNSYTVTLRQCQNSWVCTKLSISIACYPIFPYIARVLCFFCVLLDLPAWLVLMEGWARLWRINNDKGGEQWFYWSSCSKVGYIGLRRNCIVFQHSVGSFHVVFSGGTWAVNMERSPDQTLVCCIIWNPRQWYLTAVPKASWGSIS